MTERSVPIEITPETRVGEFLEAYPQLEEELVTLAPAFAKLRNPMLRKTIARITTLRQAAKVGRVPLATLINTLREAAGAGGPRFQGIDEQSAAQRPEWFDEKRIAQRLDARSMIEAGERPVGEVMSGLQSLAEGEIFELITPFVPAPIVDMATGKGFETWSDEVSADLVKTYFKSA